METPTSRAGPPALQWSGASLRPGQARRLPNIRGLLGDYKGTIRAVRGLLGVYSRSRGTQLRVSLQGLLPLGMKTLIDASTGSLI